MHPLTRRHLLASLTPLALNGGPLLLPGARLLPGASLLPVTAAQQVPNRNQGQGLGQALSIFLPQSYGARANGQDLDTAAVNAAITACTEAGGGMVYFSPGTYKCGTVVLKSNVTLYLEAGATLQGSENISDFAPMAGGVSTHGDTGARHLIFARKAEHIGIMGPGCLDGQGEAYWKPSGIPPLPPAEAWADVIARGIAEKGERPSPLLEFVECRFVRLEDVRIQNAPSWTMRPVNCDEVYVRGVSIRNPVYGHNTDGIDITGCSNVFISDCSIDTGDDAICFKSQSPYGGEPRLTRNVVVTNCVLTTCSNGFKFGTATEGGFENITFSNSVIYNGEVDYKYRVVSGIALEVVDGGWMDGVTISNIRMQRTRTPIFLRLGKRSNPFPSAKRGLRNISISDVSASESVLASSITGLPGDEIRDVSLSRITVENAFPCRPEWVGRAVPEKPDGYPEARMYGMLPCTGLYARHVRDLAVRDLAISATPQEARPSVILEDVSGGVLSGLRSTPVQGTEPVIQLNGTRDLWVTGATLPAGTAVLAGVSGAESEGVVISGNNVRGRRDFVKRDPEVPEQAVVLANNA